MMMEDNTTTQETPETTPQGQPDPEASTVSGLAEARDRYRGERDTARAELTAANARIEQLQRAEVERLASEHLAMPGDFWLSGNGIEDYLDESGSVDPDRVAADTAVILTERPGLSKYVTPANYDPSQGLGGTPRVAAEPTFADLFRASSAGARKGRLIG